MLLLLASSQTRSLLEIGFGLVFAAMYVDFDLPIVTPSHCCSTIVSLMRSLTPRSFSQRAVATLQFSFLPQF